MINSCFEGPVCENCPVLLLKDELAADTALIVDDILSDTEIRRSLDGATTEQIVTIANEVAANRSLSPEYQTGIATVALHMVSKGWCER